MTSATEPNSSVDPQQNRREQWLLIIAYLGFISLGLPDTIAGVAWPSVRKTFELSQSNFGLVFVSLGCGYCTSSFLGGRLTLAMGVGTLLATSSLLVVLAMFGFALAPTWPLFVACAVIWGAGSGGIDSALNSYSSTYFSTRHVNWLHSCYSIGATMGPLLMTAMLAGSGSWRLGYALVGSVLLAMSLVFLLTRRWWKSPAFPSDHESTAPASIRETLREPLVWYSILVFFLYTGLEFTVGQWCFTILTESRGVRAELAGIFAGLYFGAIGVGRVVLGMIADRIGLDRLVRYSMLIALSGTILFALSTSLEVSFISILLIGWGLAPVFPCLMARTPQRLGSRFATHAIGFQVSAAMLGVAAIPTSAGLAAQFGGIEVIPKLSCLLAVLLLCTHELLIRWSFSPRPMSRQ